MTDTSEVARPAAHDVSVVTFAWRDLHFHVATPYPLLDAHVRAVAETLPKVASVGQFADLLAIVLGRRVRIQTVRPSLDVRFEVGL